MAITLIVPIAGIILGLSTLLSISFVVYGINILHLTRRAGRYKSPAGGSIASKPLVAVHLPIYNELYVAGRLLESCVKMAGHYGKEMVRICVIDDSDDETAAEIDRISKEYQGEGYKVEGLRRGTRTGFKAGALQAALDKTSEPFIAVFDADFAPPEDFLDKTIQYLVRDRSVGFVQSRWVHFDRGYNAITQTLAIGVDAHFLLEQPGRWSSGYLINFNGSAGLLRTGAIIAAGGWNSDTLAEDLDLSYRMQLAGYRPVYLRDLEVPAELPPTITSLKRQQGRWARGSLQTAKKVMPRVISSKALTLEQKFEAFVHLTYYLVHPLMVASFILALVATFLNIDVIKYVVNISVPNFLAGGQAAAIGIAIVPWLVFSLLIVASTLAVLLYCIEAVRVQHLGLLQNAKEIILLVVIGYGISISNSVNALSGLFSPNTGSFLRTPKYAITGKDESWRGKKYQLALNRVTLLEALATAVGLIALYWAVVTRNLGILPILVVYVSGYLLVLALTLSQSVRRPRVSPA